MLQLARPIRDPSPRLSRPKTDVSASVESAIGGLAVMMVTNSMADCGEVPGLRERGGGDIQGYHNRAYSYSNQSSGMCNQLPIGNVTHVPTSNTPRADHHYYYVTTTSVCQ